MITLIVHNFEQQKQQKHATESALFGNTHTQNLPKGRLLWKWAQVGI